MPHVAVSQGSRPRAGFILRALALDVLVRDHGSVCKPELHRWPLPLADSSSISDFLLGGDTPAHLPDVGVRNAVGEVEVLGNLIGACVISYHGHALLLLDEPAVEIVLVQEVVPLHGQFPQRAVELVHIAIEQTAVVLPGIQEIADALRRVRGNLEIPILGLLDLISLDSPHGPTPLHAPACGCSGRTTPARYCSIILSRYGSTA